MATLLQKKQAHRCCWLAASIAAILSTTNFHNTVYNKLPYATFKFAASSCMVALLVALQSACRVSCLGLHIKRLLVCLHDLQGTELASLGGGKNTKDSFTSRTKMVLSSLQTNFQAAAEQGSVKKRRLSSGSPHRPGPEVDHCGCIIPSSLSIAAKLLLYTIAKMLFPAPCFIAQYSTMYKALCAWRRCQRLMACFWLPQSRSQLHWCRMQVSMNALVEGKGRKDASRWFFEMLVLKSRKYISLKQEEPYGDISIAATSKLLTAS